MERESKVDESPRGRPRGGPGNALRGALDGAPLSPAVRGTAAVAGLVAAGLLLTAARLHPDPSGRGTHQQLGLPPCSFVLLWNIPCPACGMTTSWALVTQGRLVAAMRANAGGALLAIIALAYIPSSCYFFLRGVATRGQWFSLFLATALVLALVAAIAQWLARLAAG
ncbi:MAG: DUF2752 domain-containing protein [Planctomycetota bacterium]|nr:MAG: DUF2752 domain-containing protein [Planctomycetota bacterium]